MLAATARWPFALVNRKAPIAMLCSYIFLLVMAAYHLRSTRTVHRATLWAGAFLILVGQLAIPIEKAAGWRSFATWVQIVAR
jgi:hypothetical protein